jgi:acyl-CoA synthetase (NDP forming)
VAHAEALDMVLLGPNMLGFANFVDRIPVTSVPGLPTEHGPVALLSQSGASSSAMLDFASMMGIGMSYMVTLGNEAMITVGHALDFLVDDGRTKAVAVFLETIRDAETFARAARRAADAGTAIVALKAGSSQLAARTAAAHTGALVGDDATIGAVLDDLGVIRVDSIEDMLITAGAAAHLGRLARPGIGVVSISGGACDIVADRAEDLGAPLPTLAPRTEAALAEIMPGYGTIQNPLDVTGAAIIDPGIFTRAVAAISQDPSVGVVAVVNGLPWLPPAGPYMAQVLVDAIGAGMQQAAVPCVYVNQVLQPVTDATRAVMAAGGVPYTIPGLRQMIVALGRVGWWSERTRALTAEPARSVADLPVPARRARTGAWSEAAARRMLAEAGIPVVPAALARSADEAAKAAAEFGGPVALKVCSPQILHKSDVGGVRLGVSGGDVRAAYEDVAGAAETVDDAEFEGVLVSPMRSGGVELLVGVVRDAQWGPILAVALGGVFVEVLKDAALTPLPVTPERAEHLLRGLRAAAVLDGVRGGAPADVPALAEVVSRIGDLALALGDELESLEVNPLRVEGSVIEALDAVVTWRQDQKGNR